MQYDDGGLTYQGRPRTCGFRLSRTDVFVLVLGISAGSIGYYYIGEFALFVPYVVGHFFLFCNVFRVRRKPELVWSGIFLVNCMIWIAVGAVNVYAILGIQFLATIAVILNEIRGPHYHGIFARRLNPQIDHYLAGKA